MNKIKENPEENILEYPHSARPKWDLLSMAETVMLLEDRIYRNYRLWSEMFLQVTWGMKPTNCP
jgi:hypothetical protein